MVECMLAPSATHSTPTFSICPRHGYLSGEHEFCPKCDEELLAERGQAH